MRRTASDSTAYTSSWYNFCGLHCTIPVSPSWKRAIPNHIWRRGRTTDGVICLKPRSGGWSVMTARPPTRRRQIVERAIEMLASAPEGIRFSALYKLLMEALPNIRPKNIPATLVALENLAPAEVYKPTKGVFRHTKYREEEDSGELRRRLRRQEPRTRKMNSTSPLQPTWWMTSKSVRGQLLLGGIDSGTNGVLPM